MLEWNTIIIKMGLGQIIFIEYFGLEEGFRPLVSQ